MGQDILLFLFSLCCIFIVSSWTQRRPPNPLPPGPKCEPFIGSLRQMPFEYQWKTFAEWSKTYGDLIYARVFGQPILVINSVDTARELLEKRGSNYSDRPRLVLIGELMQFGKILPRMRYGDQQRKHRRMMKENFSLRACQNYTPHQRYFVTLLMNRLLKKPENFKHDVERAVSSLVLMVTYGYRALEEDDPYVIAVEEASKLFVKAGPAGGAIVDFFPILKYLPSWIPGAEFKRIGLEGRVKAKKMADLPFEIMKKRRAVGIAEPSVSRDLLNKLEQAGTLNHEEEEDIKYFASGIYFAAFETTFATLMKFILAMSLHPEVARKAQQEIDTVVGSQRLPDLGDKASMPYLECVMKEVMRWYPVASIGTPHRNVKEDIYEGMSIPAGSTILPNIWWMMHDERKYANPDKFIPERFMREPGQPEPYDDTWAVFGFGRRACPGRHLAESNVWQTMACLLASFDIKCPLDANGNEIRRAAEFTTGSVSHPKPFDCRFVPRNEEAIRLIQISSPLP